MQAPSIKLFLLANNLLFPGRLDGDAARGTVGYPPLLFPGVRIDHRPPQLAGLHNAGVNLMGEGTNRYK